MKRNELYVYITLSLAMLVPVPGRLAYGIVMLIMLHALTFCGILFRKLINLFFFDDLQNVIIAVILISMCILFRQLVVLYSPLIALVLGINFYMPVLTSFVMGNLYLRSEDPLSRELVKTGFQTGIFSCFAAAFFAFRDIFGYGTISLPSPSGITEIRIFRGAGEASAGAFWASIPGALVLLALVLCFLSYAMKNMEILDTSYSEEELNG